MLFKEYLYNMVTIIQIWMNLKKKNKSLEQKYTTDRYVEAKDSSKCNTFITWLRQIQFHATIA